MEQNKTGKYFKYAIGEIVLVMVGILLALQVNNWNEKRKNHLILTSNLNGVLKELNDNLFFFEQAISIFDSINNNRIAFINHNNYKLFTRDSLEQSLENYNKDAYFIQNYYYKKIRNSKIIQYGVYEKIMENIIIYYDARIPELINVVAEYNEQVMRENEFWRYEQSTYEFNYVKGLGSYQDEKEAKNELIALLNTPTSRNILKIDVRRNSEMIESLTYLQAILKNLILELEIVLQ